MQEIKPRYVTFEQARFLKEKGLNKNSLEIECNQGYDFRGSGVLQHHGRHIESHLFYSAPEQWQVVEWASLVHNTDIEARPVRYAGDVKTSYYQPYINGCVVNMTKFATRQEALSNAIDEFLNNLI